MLHIFFYIYLIFLLMEICITFLQDFLPKHFTFTSYIIPSSVIFLSKKHYILPWSHSFGSTFSPSWCTWSGRFVFWRVLESVLFSVELVACGYFCWAGVALESAAGCRSVMVMDALWRSLCSNGPLFVFLSHSAADVDACVHLRTSIFILFLFSVHGFLWMRQVNQCGHCYSLEATLLLCSTP